MNASISKPVIFVVISVLLVAYIHSSISAFNVFALPPDPNRPGQGGTCGGITTNPRTGNNSQTCCWTERVPGKLPPNNKATYCQTCEFTTAGSDCKPKQQQLGGVSPEDEVLEQPPTPPPSGPAAPLQDGGVLQQTPGQGAAPPGTTAAPAPKPEVACGPPPMPACGPNSPPPPPPPPPTNHVVRGPQVEEAELPPATEGTQSSTLEEEQPVPVCQEGLEFNEGLGFCVPTECPEGQELNEETGICVLEEQLAAAEEPQEEAEPEEEQPSEESDSEEEDNGNN